MKKTDSARETDEREEKIPSRAFDMCTKLVRLTGPLFKLHADAIKYACLSKYDVPITTDTKAFNNAKFCILRNCHNDWSLSKT